MKCDAFAVLRRLILLAGLALPLISSGCATVPHGGRHASELTLKGLSDEEALKKVVILYNVKPETEDDITARNIALGVYIDDLKSRRSAYLASSGVFDLEFRREDLKKWTDREVVRMYDAIDSMTMTYDTAEASEMSEQEKALMVIRLTAKHVVYEEGKRRDVVRNITQAAMNALMVAASVAVAII